MTDKALCYLCGAGDGDHSAECRATPDGIVPIGLESLWREGVKAAHAVQGVNKLCPICYDPICAASAVGITSEQRRGVIALVHKPTEPPLLQCVDCQNTESCAGAMARYFNQGRCVHCGGYFRVVRA